MPLLSAPDQAIITSYPQYTDKYLSICPRTVLFSGQLDGDPTLDTISGGIVQFTTKNTSGDFNDTLAGYTIDFGTGAGLSDIGQMRLREASNGTTVEVGEIAFADVPARDNTYFSIIEERKPAIKLLRLEAQVTNNSRFPNDFTEYHDYDIAYTNQNVAISPIVNITSSTSERFPPKYAGFLDDGAIFRTVDLSSIFSEFPAGDTRASTLWDVGDGTITIGLATDISITATFPEGFRYISCTIVGTSGGTGVHYVPIWSHGDTFTVFSTNSRGFTVTADDTGNTGRKVNVRISGQENVALETDIPIGSPYVYWEGSPSFDGTSAPAQYRDQFYGWSFTNQPSTLLESPVEIEIGGMGHWMNTLQGFGIQIEDIGRTPNKHFYMESMTVDKVSHYVFREFTTITDLVNVFLTGVTTATVNEKVNKATIFQQVDLFIKSFKSNLKCDSSGAFWLRLDINYMDEGEEYASGQFFNDDRALVTNIMTIDDSMIADNGIKIKFPAIKPMGRVDAAGSWNKGVKTEPGVVASRAPGKVTGQSSATESTPFIRLDPDEDNAIIDLNYVSGRYYAKRIDPYQSFDVVLAGNMDVFEPAWGETVRFNVSPQNVGGLSLNPTDRYTIESVKIAHSNEIGQLKKRITLKVSRVTNGEPGVNIPIETIDWLNNPFFDLFYAANSVIPPNDPSTPLLASFQDEIIGFAVVGEGDTDSVLRTFTFDRLEPVWEDITPPTVPASRTLAQVDGRLDNDSGTVPIKAIYYEGTTWEIYSCADSLATVPTWILEETGTLSGTNAQPPVLVADKESDFWAVSWQSEDGVNLTRKLAAAAWEAPFAVGDATPAAAGGAGWDLGLALRNGKIVCVGRPTSSTFAPYWADGLGALTQVAGTSYPVPINSLLLDDNNSVYVSAFSDNSSVVTSQPANLFFVTESNKINDASGLANDGGAPGPNNRTWRYTDPTYDFTANSFEDSVPGQLTAEWYFDDRVLDITDWEMSWSAFYEFSADNGPTGPSPISTWTADVTVTVFTNNQGEYVFNKSLGWEGTDPSNLASFSSFRPGPWYRYNLITTNPSPTSPAETSLSVNLLEDLPTPVNLNYVKIDVVFSGTVGQQAGFRPIQYYFYLGSLDADYDGVDIGTSAFDRIDLYETAPNIVNIAGVDGYVPEKHNSITVDSKQEQFMSFHGTTGGLTGYPDVWRFTSQRGQQLNFDNSQDKNFHKRAGPIFLTGSNNDIEFSVDRISGLHSKIGDMETVIGQTNPTILNAMVLFGV